MALGRGLGAILEEVGEAYANEMVSTDDIAASVAGDQVSEVEVSLIDPNPYQPRKHFDAQKLKELSGSIQKHGLLQPVVVVEKGERFILIAGERRLRAHKLGDLPTIKAIIADVDFDEIRMRELALIENIQRENLNPIELAHSYQELITVHGITHEALAKIVHKSRSQITNTLRLLSLDRYASEALIAEKITQGHAKILVSQDASRQRILVDTIVGQKLSVRAVESLVKGGSSSKKSNRRSRSSEPTVSQEQSLRIGENLPFKHKIRRGVIEIMLPNEEEVMKFISFLEKR